MIINSTQLYELSYYSDLNTFVMGDENGRIFFVTEVMGDFLVYVHKDVVRNQHVAMSPAMMHFEQHWSNGAEFGGQVSQGADYFIFVTDEVDNVMLLLQYVHKAIRCNVSDYMRGLFRDSLQALVLATLTGINGDKEDVQSRMFTQHFKKTIYRNRFQEAANQSKSVDGFNIVLDSKGILRVESCGWLLFHAELDGAYATVHNPLFPGSLDKINTWSQYNGKETWGMDGGYARGMTNRGIADIGKKAGIYYKTMKDANDVISWDFAINNNWQLRDLLEIVCDYFGHVIDDCPDFSTSFAYRVRSDGERKSFGLDGTITEKTYYAGKYKSVSIRSKELPWFEDGAPWARETESK